MERQPFYQPDEEGTDDSKKSKGKKSSGGLSGAQNTDFSRAERPARPDRLRHVPIAPAFEGVISWRDTDNAEETPKESKERHDQPRVEEADYAPPAQIEQPATELKEETPIQTDEAPTEIEPDLWEEASQSEAFEAQPTNADTAGEPVPAEYFEDDSAQASEPAVQPRAHSQPAPRPSSAAAPLPTPNMQPANQFNQQPVAASQPNYNQAPTAPPTPNAYQPTPNAPVNAAYGGANLPPMTPTRHYNNPYYNPALHNTAPVTPGAAQPEAVSPVMPIEHPVPNHGRDPRVGGVAALLGLEYFARKRADRKLEKRVTKRTEQRFKKQEQQIAVDHQRLQEQQRQFDAEQQRQRKEMHSMRFGEVPAQPTPDSMSPTANLPRPFEASQAVFGAPERVIAGQHHHESAPGHAAAPERPVAATQQTNAEQVTQNQVEQPGIHPGPHEHVRQSAWHNIVVDERGHEVAGAIQYGEGFKRERQQEAIHHPSVSGGGQPGAMGMGTGTGTGGGISRDQFGAPMLPSGMTTPSLPQGQNSQVDPQHQLPANSSHQSNLANPWFWIMLALIIAAFFTAALI